ncbi:MAG TPA: response regulator transcription factor [Cyclobacteriaceae bacterium]|nr:response regulator transcription factor [Cyclobacteriaceae bacterium]
MIKARILLVEDDEALGFVITDNLQHNGYSVYWCKRGDEALKTFTDNIFDVCLLDVMLPGKDGFSIAESIRSINQHIPLLMLTARTLQEDRINGFRKGADDYIVKPFSMEELILRIEVFIKRASAKNEQHQQVFNLGIYVFNFDSLTLSIASNIKKLTQKEAELLKILCINQNRVLKREEILLQVWGDDDYFMGRSLDVFISRLRKYLQEDSKIEIQNYPRVGFRLQVNQ